MLLPIPIFPYSFEPCADCWENFCVSFFFFLEAVFLLELRGWNMSQKQFLV